MPTSNTFSADRITNDIDVVIIWMAMFLDNPELARAKELELKIQTFPEFVYEQSKDKQRVVIAGSHGKTTTTAMVMHVLRSLDKPFDWLVGSLVDGFEAMVGLSDAPYIIIEWDEYPESRETLKPKFLTYQHTIWVLNGIDRDHANIYTTFESYLDSFRQFLAQTPSDGVVFYNTEDAHVVKLIQEFESQCKCIPYFQHPYQIINHQYALVTADQTIPLNIFWEHNMTNLSAAKAVCNQLGVSDEDFYANIQTFQSTYNRLNLIHDSPHLKVYKDFAHSPSKLLATTKAVKNLYPDRTVIAVYELHTFSSLSKDFLPQYHDHFNFADHAIIYFNPEAVAHKKLPPLSIEDVKVGFGKDDLLVFDDNQKLQSKVHDLLMQNDDAVLLLMSSGDFGGMESKEFFVGK
jgi:UDP-N-acetylmuramate: L-alanyl-gamma-D-glutamyl-meso-diaminopimelate ligase